MSKTVDELLEPFILEANGLLQKFVMGHWDDNGELLTGAAGVYVQAAILPLVLHLGREGASPAEIQEYIESFLEESGMSGLRMGLDSIRLRNEMDKEEE